jgi:hypothetical protein
MDGIIYSAGYLGSDYYHFKRDGKHLRSVVWLKYYKYREQKVQRQMK